MATIRNPFFARNFADTAVGFRTESFRALRPARDLLAAAAAEATVTIHGLAHRLGGTAPDAFGLMTAITKSLSDGGERLEVTFAAPGGQRRFAYPGALDPWLMPGDRFTSYRVFEFVLPAKPAHGGRVAGKGDRRIEVAIPAFEVLWCEWRQRVARRGQDDGDEK
jgi:hypothetical protein